MKNYFILIALLVISLSVFSQKQNNNWLEDFAKSKSIEYKKKKKEADEYARKNNLVIKEILSDGSVMELQEIEDGIPQYYITDNAGAAQTTRANTLYLGGGLGLNVTGNGYSKVGEWDGGTARTTHQEFGSRITLGDAPSISDHSTHVAGTIMASGVEDEAKGMAYEANLTSYDWDEDEAEMALAAANGMEISNHSYGYVRGWRSSNQLWYGNTSISDVEDYKFGFYDSSSEELDDIAYNAPYYLICKSAGNDRGDGPYTTPPTAEKDGGDDGYDCIGTKGIAKNILTIGAVNEVTEYNSPSDVVMSSFSSWGPADDGRIKPDIVAKGVGVYSSLGSSDNVYASYNGTSMATPNTVGTLVLLQQHYQNTHVSTAMKAATLKALAINTADEAGPDPGPDYMFGWGLLNAKKAAELISEDATGMNVIDEQTLSNGGTYTRNITVGSNPLIVTVVWTDPSGTPTSAQLNPSTPMLVNDLDLRLTKGAITYYPWKLNRDYPSLEASNNTENNVDNVETVFIENPIAGIYTLTVDHDGTLASSQDFSIIIQGLDEYTSIPSSCSSLENPTDGATNLPPTTTVQWSEISDAISYDVYFGTDAAATNILNGENQVSNVLAYCLNSNTTYYLKVYPRNNQGAKTTCTTIWSFSTANVSSVSLPLSENFDALSAPNIPSAWEHDSDNDFDWESEAGTTPSNNTGPDDDITGGGKYLYTEASSLNNPDKTAIVYTPYFDLTTLTNPELIFNYHMYGVYMGTLIVEIFYEGKWLTLFSRTGEQHSSGSEAWTEQKINLKPYKGCSLQRIRFHGITDGWASDMAIDNVSIANFVISIVNWDGSTSTDWANPDNWVGSAVPDYSSDVVIPASANSPIIGIGTRANCNSFTLEGNATITVNGKLEVEN